MAIMQWGRKQNFLLKKIEFFVKKKILLVDLFSQLNRPYEWEMNELSLNIKIEFNL